MNYENILVLASRVKGNYVTSGHDLIDPLVNKKCRFLDYVALYEKYGYRDVQGYIFDYIRAHGIKYLVNVTSSAEFYFDMAFYKRLRDEVFVIRCIGDAEHFYDVSEQYYCQTADLVVNNDLAGIYRLKQLGVNTYLCPAAYDVSKYENKRLTKDIDVSFIGQIPDKVNRASFLRYLTAAGINVSVYGRGSKNGVISFEEKLNVYNRSKIVLSISGIAERTRLTRKFNIHRRFKAIKAPLFEGIMCGSFVLSEVAPDIEEFFEVGRELDIFHDEKEMLEKVKYYLANDAIREEAALRGYNKLKEKRYCDVAYHLPNILSKIEELSPRRSSWIGQPVYVDDVLLTNFCSFRVFALILFIKRLKVRHAFRELGQIVKYRSIELYQVRIFVIEEILDVFPRFKKLLKKLIGDEDDKNGTI